MRRDVRLISLRLKLLFKTRPREPHLVGQGDGFPLLLVTAAGDGDLGR